MFSFLGFCEGPCPRPTSNTQKPLSDHVGQTGAIGSSLEERKRQIDAELEQQAAVLSMRNKAVSDRAAAENQERLKAIADEVEEHDRLQMRQSHDVDQAAKRMHHAAQRQVSEEQARRDAMSALHNAHAIAQIDKYRAQKKEKEDAAELDRLRKAQATDRMIAGHRDQWAKKQEADKRLKEQKERDEAAKQAWMEAQGRKLHADKKKRDELDAERATQNEVERLERLEAQRRNVTREQEREAHEKERQRHSTAMVQEAHLAQMSQEEHMRQYMIAKKKAVFQGIQGTENAWG